MDKRFVNACHRAQDFLNKTGRLAYVYYCKSARRFEVHVEPPPIRWASDYKLMAISER